MKKNMFLHSTHFSPVLGRMSATEQRAGRYLRDGTGHGAPSGDAGGGAGGGAGGAPALDLPDVLDTLDGVPAKLQPFYTKDNTSGKFKLDDVSSLRSAVGNIKGENQSLKGQLSQFHELRDLGLSVEEIKALKAEKDSAEEKRAREAGDWDSLKSQMEANFESERSTLKGREGKLLKTIEKILVDDSARAVLADQEVDGNPVLLLPLIRDRVKVTEGEEGFNLQILRGDGAPMLNAANQPATLKDLFLEMKSKPEYAGAFKGLGQSGGGAPGGNAGSGGGAPASKTRAQMSNAEKATYIREHGLQAYEKLA